MIDNRYYTYILRCYDNSLYTGITNNLQRRMEEHFHKTKRCAKYTYRHNAYKLEVAWISNSRSLASRLEYYIKRLSKKDKELLILDSDKFSSLLADKIECCKYIRWDIVTNKKIV